MDYRHLNTSEPRITLASLVLLAVFVAATAFVVWAIVAQPWNSDEATVIAPARENVVIEAPTADGLAGELDVLVQPPAE